MVATGDSDRTSTADLVAVVLAVALAAAVVFSPLGSVRPVALVVGLPFVLLVPGYALVSAVFPAAGETGPTPARTTSWLGRLGLSVGGSVVAVAAVGGVLDFTVWGFQREAVAVGLGLFTLAATAVAWYRRLRLPVDRRAGTDAATLAARTRSVVVGEGPAGLLLTLVVLLSAAGAVGVVAHESTEQGVVTEFYVLGQDESGDLVAENYPTNVTVGEPTTVGVGLGAAGSGPFEGTVVASLERVTRENDTVRIRESRRLDTFEMRVQPGETTVRRHTVQLPLAGERLRLTYRLYRRGSDRPLRQVHVWLTVTPQPS
ncbi:DUF1616 domain-containing protein [Haloarcula onubensis]|uniref:DUF1616 domain-containing protein n=1 Tax=Haloarcula onubensis TaxID=2950539 RepID=A0ABU2FUX5_9EURY|nr:DUF1616 domain-containing protein [Halomicroarcula sp. S3CR25-11]MDS0284553.1 DUF1616 domain-containing protein [Halomicroarcula sp. S3CR25-11]